MKGPSFFQREIWQVSIFCQFFFYVLFCFLFFLFYSILISIVAFFHFLLNHQFNTIGDWTFRYSWEIVSFSKLLALYLIIKIFNTRIHKNLSFKDFITKNLRPFRRNIFVMLLYLTVFTCSLGSPFYQKAGNISLFFGPQTVSLLGVIIFYLTEYLFFAYMKDFFPLQKKSHYVSFYIFFPMIFYGTTIATIPFIKDLDFLAILHLLTCLIFLEFKGKGMTFAFVYIILLVGPMSAFFGQDPIWGSFFSIFKMRNDLPLHICLILWFTAYCYLFYSEKKCSS